LGLTLKSIDVPSHRVVGDKARLVCKFDMGSDTLYSVKWYKNDLEFYRYVPNDRPKLQVFATRGIHVDRSHSTKQHVLLTNLTLDSGGTYKCEVSAEAPSFRTKSAHQDMVVVVLPTKAEIKGVQPKYTVGDVVNVTCYSYRSRPAASLTWRVNNAEVNSNYHSFKSYGFVEDAKRHQDLKRRKLYPLNAELREYKPQVELGGKLETSRLGLSFKVSPQHVSTGLKLECTASIGSVYWQSFQEKIPVAHRDRQAAGIAASGGDSGGGGSKWPWSTSSKATSTFIHHANANLGRLLILSYLLPVVLLACHLWLVF